MTAKDVISLVINTLEIYYCQNLGAKDLAEIQGGCILHNLIVP